MLYEVIKGLPMPKEDGSCDPITLKAFRGEGDSSACIFPRDERAPLDGCTSPTTFRTSLLVRSLGVAGTLT